MVSTKITVYLTAIGFLLGAAIGYVAPKTTPSITESNFVLPRDKWQCFVVVFETDECVAYRLRNKELEDLDARHRKHNPKQGTPFLPTK